MKLYKILVRHCAPKDCITAIVGYVLTDAEEKIYEYINKELLFGMWGDRSSSGMRYNGETYKEQMLRLRGEYNDEFADYSDAYYGVTHYGWSEGQEISVEDQNTLLKLGCAFVI